MTMSGPCLALDVGGANLKYAVAARERARRAGDGGRSRLLASGSLAFALWREPDALPDRLREVEARARDAAPDGTWGPDAPAGRVALTLTAELADCFRDRREGVRRVVDAVETTLADPRRAGGEDDPGAGPARCRVWGTDGRWRTPERVRRTPLVAAAANWLAPATWLARRGERVLLADLGSTTTDLVPVTPGRAGTGARTDLERLQAGELVYTGLLRTPVASLLDRVDLGPAGAAPVVAERFAVAADVHLWRGDLDPAEYRCETPDGAARTREAAGRRLARMVGSDPGELGESGIGALADAAAGAQATGIARAVERQRRRLGSDFPRRACPTGAGARLLAAWLDRAGLEVVDPPSPLAGRHGRSATATTLALLAVETTEAPAPSPGRRGAPG